MNNTSVSGTDLVGSVYLHVGNSGATFSVENSSYGPKVNISTNAFGNLDHHLGVYTNKEGLLALSELFKKAAEAEFTFPPYVYPAYPSIIDGKHIGSEANGMLVTADACSVKVMKTKEDLFSNNEEILPMDANGVKYEVCESCQ